MWVVHHFQLGMFLLRLGAGPRTLKALKSVLWKSTEAIP